MHPDKYKGGKNMTFDWHTFKASCVLHLSISNTIKVGGAPKPKL